MLSQCPRFESSFGHAALLKLLGRTCRPFGSHNAREISLHSCALMIPGLHPKKTPLIKIGTKKKLFYKKKLFI